MASRRVSAMRGSTGKMGRRAPRRIVMIALRMGSLLIVLVVRLLFDLIDEMGEWVGWSGDGIVSTRPSSRGSRADM